MRREGPRPDPLAPLIASLHREGRPRVWSLVVTVFGDAVAPRGGRIATARLAELVGRLGVGEGALRTALSRLVADGTLLRDRSGRASFHRLSPAAASEVSRASRVIYAARGASEWILGSGSAPARSLALAGGAWLARDGPVPVRAVAVRGALIGAAAVEPEPAHAEALRRLARDLDALATAGAPAAAGAPARGASSWAGGKHGEGRGDPTPDEGRSATSPPFAGASPEAAPGLAPLDALAARTLLIHRWRRLTLRWPDLPEPEAAAEAATDARSRVAAAYRALLPASEAWLDAALPPMAGTGPADGDDLRSGAVRMRATRERFG